MALDDELGEGRRLHRDRHAWDQFQRPAHEAAGDGVFVGVHRPLPQAAAEGKQRVVPDDDRHRDRFAPPGGPLRIVPEMPAAVQAGAETGPAHDLQPVVAGVAHPGIRVPGDDNSVGYVGAAVFGKVIEDRQRGQIEAVAGYHRVQNGARLPDHRVDRPVAESAPGFDQV